MDFFFTMSDIALTTALSVITDDIIKTILMLNNLYSILNTNAYDHEWLRAGNIDKTVYIVVKNTKKSEIEKYPDIKLIYEENGFAFYKRSPKGVMSNE